MKSILFASTALVAFAGAAAAQGVTLSGGAEMGIADSDAAGADPEFIQSVDVRFTMTGETDNGLTFGATIDLDDAVDMANAGRDTVDETGFSDFVVTVGGAFGTLTMGDTDGALDWALQEVNFGPGSIGDDETAHAGFSGNTGLEGSAAADGQVLRYNYTLGDFGVAVSVTSADQTVANADEALGLGLKYSLDLGGSSVNLGFGVETASVGATDIDLVGASADATFGGVRVGVSLTELSVGTVDTSHVGVGIGYTTGAISVAANYGEFDRGGAADSEGFGLNAGYDLGGGASIVFGYGSSDRPGTAADIDTYTFGLSMSF